MAKTFNVAIQGIAESFKVPARGTNSVAAMITRDPERFRMKEAPREGVVGIENEKTGRATFYKIGRSGFTLYPISAATAAVVMQCAGR